MSDLSGKRALVTGASRGIGRAIALRLARAGADVMVNYAVNEDAANDVAREIDQMGRSVLVCQADVRDKDAVKALVDRTVDGLGGLDILVNNAGVVRDQYLTFMKDEAWDEVMGTCAGRTTRRRRRGSSVSPRLWLGKSRHRAFS